MSNEFWVIALVLAFLYFMRKKPVHATASASPGPTSDAHEDLTPSRPLTVHEEMARVSKIIEQHYNEDTHGGY